MGIIGALQVSHGGNVVKMNANCVARRGKAVPMILFRVVAFFQSPSLAGRRCSKKHDLTATRLESLHGRVQLVGLGA